MSDGPSNSLINLGDIAKPADTLIKKVSKAVGGVFKPYQIKRIAKAEAEAAIIKAQTEIQITDLDRRAMHRFVEEEARRQQNIEQITNKALPQLKEGIDASKMDDDWVTNFFDKSRIVSDEEMQNLWAKVLAGEANAPGAYSKRTVNFLGDFDKTDAELFTNLCRFTWQIGIPVPLIFTIDAEIYKTNNLRYTDLAHLESIGLIQFDSLGSFQRVNIPKRCIATYYNESLILEFENEKDSSLAVGNVLLTKIGLELTRVSATSPIPGFFEYVKEHWKKYLPQSKTAPNSTTNPIPPNK